MTPSTRGDAALDLSAARATTPVLGEGEPTHPQDDGNLLMGVPPPWISTSLSQQHHTGEWSLDVSFGGDKSYSSHSTTACNNVWYNPGSQLRGFGWRPSWPMALFLVKNLSCAFLSCLNSKHHFQQTGFRSPVLLSGMINPGSCVVSLGPLSFAT